MAAADEQGEETLEGLLGKICSESRASVTDDKNTLMTRINCAMPKLLGRLSASPTNMALLAMQVVRSVAESPSCLVDTSLLCEFLGRVVSVVSDPRHCGSEFRREGALSAIAVLSLLRIKEPGSFGAFFRDCLTLAHDMLRPCSPAPSLIGGGTAGKSTGVLEQVRAELSGEGRRMAILEFALAVSSGIVERFPTEMWREVAAHKESMWVSARKAVKLVPQAAMGCAESLVRHYGPPTSGEAHKLCAALLRASRSSDLSPQAAVALSSCLDLLYARLPAFVIVSSCELLTSAVTASLGGEIASPCAASLLRALGVTAKECWLQVTSSVGGMLARGFPYLDRAVQEAVIGLLIELLVGFQVRLGRTAVPSDSRCAGGEGAEPGPPRAKRRRGDSKDGMTDVPSESGSYGAAAIAQMEQRMIADAFAVVTDKLVSSARLKPASLLEISRTISLLYSFARLVLPQNTRYGALGSHCGVDVNSALDALSLRGHFRTGCLPLLVTCITAFLDILAASSASTQAIVDSASRLVCLCHCVVARAEPSEWLPASDKVRDLVTSLANSPLILCSCDNEDNPPLRDACLLLLRSCFEVISMFPGRCPASEAIHREFVRSLSSDMCTARVCSAIRSLSAHASFSGTEQISWIKLVVGLLAAERTPSVRLQMTVAKHIGLLACASSHASSLSSSCEKSVCLCNAAFPKKVASPWWFTFCSDAYDEEECCVAVKCHICAAAVSSVESKTRVVDPSVVRELVEWFLVEETNRTVSAAFAFYSLAPLLVHCSCSMEEKCNILFSHLKVMRNSPGPAPPNPTEATQRQAESGRMTRMSIAKAITEFGGHYLHHQQQTDQQLPELQSPLMVEAFVGRIRIELIKRGDSETQEALMTVLRELGCLANGGCLTSVLLSLIEVYLDSFGDKDPTVKCVCLETFGAIADRKGVPLSQLLRADTPGRVSLCKLLLPRISTNSEAVDDLCSTVLHCDVIHETLSEILPPLVVQAGGDDKQRNTLGQLALRCSKSIGELCMDHIAAILCHLLTTVDVTALEPARGCQTPLELAYLEGVTSAKPQALVNSCVSDLLERLVFMMDDAASASKVKGAIIAMIGLVEGPEDMTQQEKDEKVSRFLSKHFLFLMDVLARRSKEGVDQRRLALTCLTRLLPLVGAAVSRPKVIAFLKVATMIPSLQKLACDAWLIFLREIDDLSKLSHSELSSIVSYLISALGTSTEAAVSVLEFLLVEHNKDLSSNFAHLPLIPDLEATAKIREAVRSQIPSDWTVVAERLREAVTSGNSDSVLNVLAQLRSRLQQDGTAVSAVGLSDNTDSLSELILPLIRCTKDSSESVQMLAGQCLGELGAIDPGRVDLKLRPELVVNDPNCQTLGLDLLKGPLIKALRKNSERQDYAAVAIQEVLGAIGCRVKPGAKSPHKRNKTLDSLPEDIRQTLQPYMSSNYKLGSMPAVPTSPVYRPGMSYRQWIQLWVASLISLTTSHDRCQPVFIACSAVVRDDMPTATFLLPYLVFSVMKHSSADGRTRVLAEMTAVLQTTNASSDASEVAAATLKGIGASVTSPPPNVVAPSESAEQCAQCVFFLFDWLSKLSENLRKPTPTTPHSRSKKQEPDGAPVLDCARELTAIPQLMVAMAAQNSRSPSRALLHLENHIRQELSARNSLGIAQQTDDKEHIVQAHMGLLQNVLVSLDDYDAYVGVAQMRKSTTLKEQICDHENAGNWHEALSCYDQAMHLFPEDSTMRTGRLRCMREIGLLDMMLSLVRGELLSAVPALRAPSPSVSIVLPPSQVPPSARSQIVACGMQAAWRLGEWGALGELVESPACPRHGCDWDISLGKALLYLRNGAKDSFQETLSQARRAAVASLAAASLESYQRCYPDMVRLQIIRELEQGQSLAENYSEILKSWDTRISCTQTSFKTQEPVLSVRRALLNIAKHEEQDGLIWLRLAKLARKEGNYQTAFNCVKQASTHNSPGCFLEEAKLKWAQNDQLAAIGILKNSLMRRHQDSRGQKALPRSRTSDSFESLSPLVGVAAIPVVGAEEEVVRDSPDMLKAKAAILLGRWCEQTGAPRREVRDLYDDAKKLAARWEKAFFYLAKFFDSPTGELPDLNSVRHAIKNYGEALTRGTKYIFHSLPRLLTLWFGAGIAVQKASSEDKQQLEGAANFSKINDVIKDLAARLPAYIWLQGLSQLKSRLTHRNRELQEVLFRILVKILNGHPQQSLWGLIGLYKSRVPARQKAAAKILQSSELPKTVAVLVERMDRFASLLIDLAEKKPNGNTTKFNLRTDHRLKELTNMQNSQILVPLQRSFTAALPTSERTENNHNAFPPDLPVIKGLLEEVEVIGSLVKPKKILVLGTNGVEYLFLAKPADDLRRDARMMEIFGVINKIIRHDPDSRKRKLHIKTYCVVPLNEECGLIEWIRVTHSRHQTKEIRERWTAAGTGNRADIFHELVRQTPLVFYQWFLQQFPEISAWYDARLQYTRTLAVMSMVGMLVGLGDRHGENILFYEKTGETLHVDFNCLFWKGETFQVPEKVPFRLTRNMIDAMGITGYEGTFRRVCEITLSLLRSNEGSLMSLMESFIYDPLLEWEKDKHKQAVSGESKNGDALECLSKIRKLLHGLPISATKACGVSAARSSDSSAALSGCPVSVASQVHLLIEEATSVAKLSEMYVGWAPWL